MNLEALKAFSENKVILITGKDGCGKSLLAKLIINQWNNRTAKIDGRNLSFRNDFMFENIYENTRVIFIDDVVNTDILEALVYCFFGDKVIINKRLEPQIILKNFATIIVVDDACKIPLGSSFRRRVKIINID